MHPKNPGLVTGAICGALAAAFTPLAVNAHAIAGMRLFPSTLTFDDPGIGAELPLTFSHINVDGTEQNVFSASFTKPITPGFSLVASTDYQSLGSGGASTLRGWDNFALGGAWQVYNVADTESIGAFSLTDSIAHTGSRALGSEYSTWSPEFDFGQGLGNVSTNWLKPAALSGSIGMDIPSDARVPRTLNWALSLQYSIPYLQNFVKYVGIKAPFNNLIPIIEFPMQTCLDNGCRGQTTGYVAPGVIWIGHYFQWGVELQIPVNRRTGNSVGILIGFDFYLDDLAPHTIGTPLFN